MAGLRIIEALMTGKQTYRLVRLIPLTLKVPYIKTIPHLYDRSRCYRNFGGFRKLLYKETPGKLQLIAKYQFPIAEKRTIIPGESVCFFQGGNETQKCQ